MPRDVVQTARPRRPSRAAVRDDAGAIKSVQKAIAILNLLHDAHRPMRMSELAQSLALSQSVVSRMVSTLSARGLLEVDEETGQVHIGLGLLLIGISTIGGRRLDYVAAPILARLATAFEEYVSLSRLVSGRVLLIRSGTVNTIDREAAQVTVVPFHASAPGKILTAFRSQEAVKALIAERGLAPYTDRTITSSVAFLEEIKAVREAGVAVDEGEMLSGHRHVAAPIRDHTGAVVAAVSAGGAIERMHEGGFERLTQEVVSAAHTISRKLGFKAGGSDVA